MKGKLATVEAKIARIAERQYGVVSVRQLRDAGLTEEAIRRRVRAARLHRVHRGVYAVGHPRLSPEARLLAAVLAAGAGPCGEGDSVLHRWRAAVSHRSAACLWNLLSMRDSATDVVVRGGSGRARRRGIRLHRSITLGPAEVTLRRGIPVTTPARTIADLRRASEGSRPGAVSARELRRATRQAEVLGLPIGDEREDRTRSDLEADFLLLCARHGLSPPEVNVPVGRHLVDFLWRERRIAVETDGYLYHRGRVAFEDDRERDLELRRLGYEVLRLSERQVSETPDRVAETLAALLHRRR